MASAGWPGEVGQRPAPVVADASPDGTGWICVGVGGQHGDDHRRTVWRKFRSRRADVKEKSTGVVIPVA